MSTLNQISERVADVLLELAETYRPLFSQATMRRGELLADDDAVGEVMPIQDGITAPVAAQGHIYQPTLVVELPSERVQWTCGCLSEKACEHAAALLVMFEMEMDDTTLYLLEEEPGEEELEYDEEPRLRSVETPGPASAAELDALLRRLAPGMSIDDVRVWAGEAHVQDLAERRVSDVASQLVLASAVGRIAWMDRRPIAEMIAVRSSTTPFIQAVQPALVGWLRNAARCRLEASVAERERLGRRRCPADTFAAAIFDVLERVRQQLRMATNALSANGPSGRVRIETDPIMARYERGREMGCNDQRGSSARIAFDDLEDGWNVTPRCDCDLPSVGCPTLLAAVEATLDLLGLPARAAEADVLLQAMRVPAWTRALQTLDLLATAPEPTRGDHVIAFKAGSSYFGLGVVPCVATPKKRGGYSLRKPRPDELLTLELTRAEQHAVDLLAPDGEVERHGGRPFAAMRALALLEGHPRVFLDVRGAPPLKVVAVDAALHVEREESGAVRVGLSLGGERIELEEAHVLFRGWQGGLAVRLQPQGGVCTVVRAPERLVKAVRAFMARGAVLPAAATPGVLDRLPALSAAMPLSVAPSLRGTEVPASTSPHVRLTLHPDGALAVSLRVQPLPDGRAAVPGLGVPELYVHRAEGTVCAVRDLAAESHAASELATRLDLPPDPSDPWTWVLIQPEIGLDVLSALGACGDSVEVLWTDERRVRLGSADITDIRLRVGRDRQWFRLGGELATNVGAVPLGELLAAVRDQRRYVRVADQQWVRIGDALRDQLAAAAQLAADDGARLPLLAAPLVEALAADGATVEADGSFTEMMERLRTAERSEPAMPEGLHAELRDYQTEGVRWMLRLARWAPGACLADDMGLGKTVQALAVLLDRMGVGPALVVAPTSVGFNWQREGERFAPGLRIASFRGRADLDRLDETEARDEASPHVIVTSYDLLVRYAEPLSAIKWATLVLDEAQAIKNPATRRARAVFGIEAGFTLALSGTPLENHTGELWSLFKAVAPGLLGSQEDFGRRFQGPVERQKDPRVRRALARLIRPFVLRRLKSEVARELPERTEVRLDIDLSKAERRLYDEVRASVLAALAGADPSLEPGQRRFQVLAALTRLRQLACHPKLLDDRSTVGSSKLAALRELVAELRDNGHRALVFSQFTSLLALAREALVADGVTLRYLDGSTPAARRREEVDAFQRGEADVFLLSLKAGGTGLNLTAADYVIHLDPWWNPAVEDQATDRAHRIGQERPVTVYRLVARGTVEDGIVAMHADKRELVAAVLDGTGSASALSAEELLAIISNAGTAEDDEPLDDAAESLEEREEPPHLRLVRSSQPPREAPASAPAPSPSPSEARTRPLALVSKEAPDTPRGSSEAPSGTAPRAWPDVLDALTQALDDALSTGALAREASARSYERVAARIARFAAARDHSPSADTLDSLVDTYRGAATAGTPGIPKSDEVMAAGARKWLMTVLESG